MILTADIGGDFTETMTWILPKRSPGEQVRLTHVPPSGSLDYGRVISKGLWTSVMSQLIDRISFAYNQPVGPSSICLSVRGRDYTPKVIAATDNGGRVT